MLTVEVIHNSCSATFMPLTKDPIGSLSYWSYPTCYVNMCALLLTVSMQCNVGALAI
jgi:hypothetical protein